MHRKSENRVEIIDALRGLSILLMVVYHLCVDLVMYHIMPAWLLYNPVVNSLQFFFACVFIFVSGISSRFSRSNLRRGLYMLAAAMVITVVTWIYDPTYYVRFGILHFLGCAVLFYAATAKLISRISPKVQLWLFGLLFLAAQPLRFYTFPVRHLWALGILPSGGGVNSSDFFPIFPYLFIFLFGTAVGWYIRERRFPGWFYRFSCPPLSFCGRHTIWVYLLHQPVCLGITLLVARLLGV